MADEYKFPMRLRSAMAQAAVVLRNSSSDHYRELDEDMQSLVRRTLDEVDAACIESNLAVPTWHKSAPGAQTVDDGAPVASQDYAHNLADLQAEAYERYGMTPDETRAAAHGLYRRNLITDPLTKERRLAEFMFAEASSLINSYRFVSGSDKYDPEYEAPCWTRDLESIEMGIVPRAMPAAALFGFSMSEAETRVYGLVHARFLSLFVRPRA